MPKKSLSSTSPRFIETPDEMRFVSEAKDAVHKLLKLKLPKELTSVLLDALLWQITVAHGKYKTRFRSKAIVEPLEPIHELRHDHVFTRKSLKRQLLQPACDEKRVAEILECAIACTITKKEHDALTNKDEGWERYRHSGIVVYDCSGPKPVLCAIDELVQRFPPLQNVSHVEASI